MPQMYKKTTITSYIFVSKPLYLKQNRAYSRLFDTQTYDMETLFRTERTLSYCPDDLSNLKSSEEQFRLHNERKEGTVRKDSKYGFNFRKYKKLQEFKVQRSTQAALSSALLSVASLLNF